MIERDGMRLRHELKFNINHIDYRVLRSRLSAVMSRDAHSGPEGLYHIRSLYFDDYRNSALAEKQAGVYRRKKYRIRIYNHSDSVIKLEKKTKVDQYISKEVARLSMEDAKRIISGDVAFLASSKDRLLRAFYIESRCKLLRPNVIVEYYREAYTHPVGNVRITFDTDLHTGMGCTDLFNPDIFTMRVIDEPGVILEIKYDNALPKHIQGLIPNTILPRTAIGKFVIARKFTKYNEWEDT